MNVKQKFLRLQNERYIVCFCQKKRKIHSMNKLSDSKGGNMGI